MRHPCKFQWFSRLRCVTARHSSSRRQPNFEALNRGPHLCSAGRPSHWALAYILVMVTLCNRADRCFYVVSSFFLSFFLLLFSSPNLSCRRGTTARRAMPVEILPFLLSIFLWSPYVIWQTIIFSSCGFFFFFLFSFFPRLISGVGDWMSTILPHMVWPYSEFRMQV